MNRKSWPYWVRGGITFIVAAFLISSALNQLPRNPESDTMRAVSNGLAVFHVLLVLPAFPLAFKIDALSLDNDPATLWLTLVAYILVAIYWFVLGAIPGYIYGMSGTRTQLNTGSPPTRG